MSTGLARALRFSRSWASPPSGLTESEVTLPLPGGRAVPGTLVVPAGSGGARGWVVLHGMTRPGRTHPELMRFVRALASTGGRVLVPEIRDWMDLRFAPERAQEVLRGAVAWMHDAPGAGPGGVMLVGFSFGAPQALAAAADPETADRLRGVVGWGGYGDLARTFRFSFTGEHRWNDVVYHQRPDPYARWIIGANCLPLSPALRAHEAVVEALHSLAVTAGERRIQAGDPVYDPMKATLRRGLPSADRDLFDLFAPPSDREPDRDAAEAVVAELVPVARREIPLLEPLPGIGTIGVPVRLLHGRSDRLIPFTESMQIGRALAASAVDLSIRVTGLFGHSGGDATGSVAARLRENLRFLEALTGIFRVA